MSRPIRNAIETSSQAALPGSAIHGKGVIMNCGQTSHITGSEREIEIQDNSSTACRTGLTTGLAIVGGATLGAALMYLFDSETGPDRRERVKGLTGSAIAST